MKVWDNGSLGTLNKFGDLPSYFISKSIDEVDVVFQAMVLFAGVGLVANTYYGDLYLDYEVEFSMPLVPPTNFNNQLQYSTAGGATNHNLLTWFTEDAGQIEFWGARQGMYFCTLADVAWNAFAKCKDYVNRNFYGSSFILTVVATITDGVLSNYKSIIFAIYPDIAAATIGGEAVLEVSEDDMNVDALDFEGTMICSLAPLVVTVTDPVQVNAPSSNRIPKIWEWLVQYRHWNRSWRVRR